MKLPSGYSQRDGVWVKWCEFVSKYRDGLVTFCIETLVRSANGRLLRVERSKRNKCR